MDVRHTMMMALMGALSFSVFAEPVEITGLNLPYAKLYPASGKAIKIPADEFKLPIISSGTDEKGRYLIRYDGITYAMKKSHVKVTGTKALKTSGCDAAVMNTPKTNSVRGLGEGCP